MTPTPNMLAPEHALTYMTGGKAKVTLRSKLTGTRFTYRISAPNKKGADVDKPAIFFVSLLTGPDNDDHFRYFGYIRVIHGRWRFTYGAGKALISYEAPAAKAFAFCFNEIISLGRLSNSLEVWHEGTCCRCGRTLTVPESIKSGIGPECEKIKQAKRQKHAHT